VAACGVDWVLWLNQTGLCRLAAKLSEHVLRPGRLNYKENNG